MYNIKYFEIKVGNSNRFILEDSILREKELDLYEKRKDLIGSFMGELIAFTLIYQIAGISFAAAYALSNISNKVVKFFI